MVLCDCPAQQLQDSPVPGAKQSHHGLSSKTGVHNLWATDQYQSGPVRNWATQQEVSSGQVGKRSFAHSTYHLSPPELHLLPPATTICGKIVFHKTGPWCQKGWGPLLYTVPIFQHPKPAEGSWHTEVSPAERRESWQHPESCAPSWVLKRLHLPRKRNLSVMKATERH